MLSVMDLLILDQLEKEDNERKQKNEIMSIINSNWTDYDLQEFLNNNPHIDQNSTIKDIKIMLLEGNKTLFTSSEYYNLLNIINSSYERKR